VILLPEKIPVRIPMSVIPIWTVDKNLFGEFARSSAVTALALPFLAAFSSLFLRADISAISDIEKTPFSKIRKKIIIISICHSPDRSVKPAAVKKYNFLPTEKSDRRKLLDGVQKLFFTRGLAAKSRKLLYKLSITELSLPVISCIEPMPSTA